ncbi:hypothetical protein CALVIDRAFT_303801 [Calocera viscosa TUFC12733]|uniref:Uncharacterized protein n=1 Tax=Calocera viscosa (strain TUFC12733) TaxID=1330018 RepID=A0A167IF85_CALVF|nr:hypothetical protein CALVIDRAFT_303801 [Calocera viscosa TUFC12733]
MSTEAFSRTAGPSTSRLNRLPLTSPAIAPSSGQVAAARFFSGQALSPPNFAPPRVEQSPSFQASEWGREFTPLALPSSTSHDNRLDVDMETALRRAQNHIWPSASSNIGFGPSTWASEFRPASASYAAAAMLPTIARITEIPQSMWDQEFARIDVQPHALDVKDSS